MSTIRLPAVYMRGGTSKGVFFKAEHLPAAPRECEPLLLRVIGSPDPFGKQIDGMGAATSSTSKVVILSRSRRPDCDVDYLFGQVGIDAAVIDWSGNCGNLTAAVGPFAIAEGLVPVPPGTPREGTVAVRIWQANLGKRIIAHVPVRDGQVVEQGEFFLDGVPFPAAEIKIEYLDPGGMEGEAPGEAPRESPRGAMFPTGQVQERLQVPGLGALEATLINAGNPTIFVAAQALGLTGTELQERVNGDPALLQRCEAVRAQGAVAMGLAASAEEATTRRQHTPKLAFVAPPQDYTASSGKRIAGRDFDLLARIISMGKLHHAFTGTGAVALAAAAAIPGTVVQCTLGHPPAEGLVRLGHTAGLMTVGAVAEQQAGAWSVSKVIMSRSARRLMEGWVYVPSPEQRP